MSWSSFCHSVCLQSALPPSGLFVPLPDPPDLSNIPNEYYNLQEVFSKEHMLFLPSHRPYNCAVDLLPGATLPSGRLFNLSRPECEAMKHYTKDSLAAGIIRLSSSPVGTGFFFVN